MDMRCEEARRMIQDHIDGRLLPDAEGRVRDHLRSCSPCSVEEAELRRVGDLLRLWAAGRAEAREPQLSAMWTRVRAGIAERRESRHASRIRRWLLIPAVGALAVLILLFYPSDGTRVPFHPKSFDVTVESLESDSATVALVDKGKDLPRVIWIIDHEKT
jgi:anti-sigma factor RsiW